MELEQAMDIIDTMYQNRYKEKEIPTENGISIGEYSQVKFTELERASVRILGEVVHLLKENRQIKTKLKEVLAELVKLDEEVN